MMNSHAERRLDPPASPRPELAPCLHPTTIAALQRGIILHDLVHCALLARGTAGALALRREGPLLVQRAEGREIVMELTPEGVAAVVHDASSPRSPLRNRGASWFEEMRQAAPPAKQRVLERLAVGMRPPGAHAPWATTLLWSEGEQLCSPGTWSDFLAHGGWMLESLTMEPRSALRGYQRAHALRDALVEWIARLHEKRVQNPNEWIVIDRGEFDLFLLRRGRSFAEANDILLRLRIHTPYRPS